MTRISFLREVKWTPPALSSLQLIKWWMILRVIVVSTTMAVVWFFLSKENEPSAGSLLPPAVTIVTAIVSFLFYRTVKKKSPSGIRYYFQYLFDISLFSLVNLITLSVNVNFVPLFVLSIAVASILSSRGGAFFTATLASVFYLPVGLRMVSLGYSLNRMFVLDNFYLSDRWIWLNIILQIFIFYTVALITSHLNIRLHLTGSLLEDTRRLLSQYRLDTKEILENVSSGLVTCNSSGVIIYANAASGQLLGIPSEELPGRPAGKIFARLCPEIAGIIDSAIQSRRVARRRRVKLSTMEGGREGSVVSLAVSSSVLLEGSGRLRGVSLIFEDITPEVKAQELELRTGKLEAVAELAASLAHEIKNPLASISSAVELMRDDTGASRQTRHRKLVDLILKESGRLTELLKEFLQFASGSFGPSERIVLGPLLTSVIESAKNHPDWRKNVRVRVSPEVSSMNIAGPPSSVSQVFYNLLINAVQAEGPDHRRASSITIESCSDVAGRRQLAAGEELNSRQWLWLRLYDNGPGIDKSLRERIFEPFYTTRKGGFGLGLAVVHRIVNSLGGLIYADSSPEGPGGGAFIIALPMDTGKEAGTAPGGEGKVEIETEKSSIS